ncbi:putative serine protease K12H4.7 [Trichinella pseudospiralis]|uniref:Putative serine protease K12H4.7 n=1 Tax=Trichinella pseudospiralis TaxID=6337 RepID=A0A0V1ENJ3_TRIPS|nr:putative serine protease K12H4.7 [Trichinella pseudospiralis]
MISFSISLVNCTFFRHGRLKDGIFSIDQFFFNDKRFSNTRVAANFNYFQQNLDHFHHQQNITWPQRYWINTKYYKPGGPSFLLIGGEGPAISSWIQESEKYPKDWMKKAQTFGAICFMLEHRYYGESHPTDNMKTENLRWLTSDQALADVANFISYATTRYNLQGSQWITFGGSYAGLLSGWSRLKYPHLITGAVASSAPFQIKVNFHEYLDSAFDSIKKVNANCGSEIENAILQMRQLLRTEYGRRELKEKLSLCKKIKQAEGKDVQNLFAVIADMFSFIVQYNQPKATMNIRNMCEKLTDLSGGDPVTRLGVIIRWMLRFTSSFCLNFRYADMIAELSDTKWSKSSIFKQRIELFVLQIDNGNIKLARNLVIFKQQIHFIMLSLEPMIYSQFFLDICKDTFGKQFSEATVQTGVYEKNVRYGGKQLKKSNIILINGSVDPWHRLGLLNNPHPLSKAIFINGSSHCADMYPELTGIDPETLIKARREITGHIASWILQ